MIAVKGSGCSPADSHGFPARNVMQVEKGDGGGKGGRRAKPWRVTGLWAESVSQGEKEKWDKNRAGVDWWHYGKVRQGEDRQRRKGVMETTAEGRVMPDILGDRLKEFTSCRRQKAECRFGVFFYELKQLWTSLNTSSVGEVIWTILTSSSSLRYPWLCLHSFRSGKGTSLS